MPVVGAREAVRRVGIGVADGEAVVVQSNLESELPEEWRRTRGGAKHRKNERGMEEMRARRMLGELRMSHGQERVRALGCTNG